jgi:hypothetical protein
LQALVSCVNKIDTKNRLHSFALTLTTKPLLPEAGIHPLVAATSIKQQQKGKEQL